MYKIYQVEYGDTIDLIAKKTNSTSDNIKNINGLNGDKDLVVGGLIIVPKENEQLFENYRVQQGDSIYSISRMYGVSPETLLLLNGLKSNEYIYPSQEIIVPLSGTKVYITQEGDTLDKILSNLNVDANTLSNQNKRIFVVEDQLIVNKKS